jgi:serine protease Do
MKSPILNLFCPAAIAVSMAVLGQGLGAEPPKLRLNDAPVPADAKPTLTFNPVVKKASASVVNIYSTKTVREGPANSPMFDDPFFRRFFGGNMENLPSERRSQALGSGVIVTPDGYILTANHVVEGAAEIKVALPDEATTYTAKLVGSDPKTEVAVIKVEAKDLPAITLADSDKLVVGDVVLAIGNPFGLGQTVTMGIVSATGRSGMGIVDYEDFIQTDASINPGNSGGALVDATGRLVGINTAILSRSGGNQGVGFAIPTNLARLIMERLVTDGRVSRGYLGVMIQPVTPELAKEFKLESHAGALVGGVNPGSPAGDAGLKEGDVITSFNNKKITNSRHLRMLASQTLPGTTVPVGVMREGKEQTFDVKLTEAPAETVAREDEGPDGRQRSTSGTGALEGVKLDDLNPNIERQLNLPRHVRGGALVVQLSSESPAAAAGLREGDVIMEINRQPVNGASEAIALSRDARDGRVLLRVWSGDGSRYLVINSKLSR